MTFQDLRNEIRALYQPILLLEDILPIERRKKIEQMVTGVLILCVVLAVVFFASARAGAESSIPTLEFFGAFAPKIYGALLIVVAVRYVLTALEAFHRSYYYRGLALVMHELASDDHIPVGFEVGSIVYNTGDADITGGFLNSDLGQEIMIRSSIPEVDFAEFLRRRAPGPSASALSFENAFEKNKVITLLSYARALFLSDPELAQFLREHNVQLESFAGAAGFVMRMERARRRNERWWSRDILGRVQGVGKSWSYGQTYFLERYGHDMVQDAVYPQAALTARDEEDEVDTIEAVLARGRQSNVILIGEDGSGKREVLARLAHTIEMGTALPQLEHKRIFLLDPGTIIASYKEKGAFEEEFTKVMMQAVRAGNIVAVFENLPELIRSTGTIGSNFVELLQPYLRSSSIQIIATSSPESYHRDLERSGALMEHFEPVAMHNLSNEGSLRILEQIAAKLERRHGVLVTYPALEHIVASAGRYFPDGIMPDKAIDLLSEALPRIEQEGHDVLVREDVDALIEEKTGVPMGAVDGAEKSRLMSLEKLLHERVVGQDEAVNAVAAAMRRARAGVQSPDRPMGTFLFLGPTGVGKTETAKALAEALFGSQDQILRLDMSEFSTPDALDRLIGDADSGTPGRLATLLREKQHGVLLLDEFEKATPDVHNLFLQILDEGRATDAFGREINARSTVIIATSNAGADLIMEQLQDSALSDAERRTLVDQIIQRGIFRPELINRFDGVIIFHPLAQSHVRDIAHRKLLGFTKRIESERGITIKLSASLIDRVVRDGYDPQFGGRPLNRAIEELVEQVIADKIISGEAKPGATVTL